MHIHSLRETRHSTHKDMILRCVHHTHTRTYILGERDRGERGTCTTHTHTKKERVHTHTYTQRHDNEARTTHTHTHARTLRGREKET